MPKLRERTGYPSGPLFKVPGSTIATLPFVPEIPQKKLRNEVGEILRRAEAGEVFTITVSGRPVAKLGPLEDDRTWVDSSVLEELAKLPPDPTLRRDLERFGGLTLRDPWAERE
jgi:prevent-host-death family protein